MISIVKYTRSISDIGPAWWSRHSRMVEGKQPTWFEVALVVYLPGVGDVVILPQYFMYSHQVYNV